MGVVNWCKLRWGRKNWMREIKKRADEKDVEGWGANLHKRKKKWKYVLNQKNENNRRKKQRKVKNYEKSSKKIKRKKKVKMNSVRIKTKKKGNKNGRKIKKNIKMKKWEEKKSK